MSRQARIALVARFDRSTLRPLRGLNGVGWWVVPTPSTPTRRPFQPSVEPWLTAGSGSDREALQGAVHSIPDPSLLSLKKLSVASGLDRRLPR